MSESTKRWEIAKSWYDTDQTYQRLQRANDSLGIEEKIPEDIYSKKFAQWLTNEFRHAMNKGMQLASADNPPPGGEKETLSYIDSLRDGSFEGWDGSVRNSYLTALISVEKFIRKHNSPPSEAEKVENE